MSAPPVLPTAATAPTSARFETQTPLPTSLRSDRLVLVPLDRRAASAVLAGRPVRGEAWAPGYPLTDEVGTLRLLVDAPDDPSGWGSWQMVRDGVAVGGIALQGCPDDDGDVEVGYALVPQARGAGLAAEALRVLAGWALEHGARQVYGDTDTTNVASQRTLLNAGFLAVDLPDSATSTLRFTLSGGR